MKTLQKIWQKIYHYFNPTYEERLRRHREQLGIRVLTPEEQEEEARKIEELYRMIDERFGPDEKKK